jgi:hypothetical protein
MPELGKNDIYEAWKLTNAPNVPPAPTFWELSVCPSDISITNKSEPWTSYVANAGRLDGSTPPDSKYHGIFQDHAIVPHGARIKVDSTDIKDGVSTTLLLAENTDANYYTYVNPSAANYSAYTTANATNDCSERGAGFLYWTPLPSALPDQKIIKINGTDPTAPTTLDYLARPSSSHSGGGAAVTFADGSTRFISDEIDYGIYSLLVTPYGRKADPQQTGIISEGDVF